jgi:hypothetical protein
MARKHWHFTCTSTTCQEGFCTLNDEYQNMTEGDACPVCNIATVKRVHQNVLDENDLGIGPHNRDEDFFPEDPTLLAFTQIKGVMDKVRQANQEDSRLARETADINAVMVAASNLFPHISSYVEVAEAPAVNAVLTESEVGRAMRSVDLALVMRARAAIEAKRTDK